VLFFVSPQLWAWKKHRIKLVQKYVDRMLVIFPFEEPFYRERGVKAEFVGHPMAEQPAPTISRAEFAAQNGLDPSRTWIGLLPGSRAKEIRDNLPEMLLAARRLDRDAWRGMQRGTGTVTVRSLTAAEAKAEASFAGYFQYVLPLAGTLSAAQREFTRRLVEELSGGLSVRLVDDARAALFHARASIVASGTATVEAALIGNPFVVVYRVSPITFAIAKRVVTVPHVAMANLIAGKRLVPELIQNDFTASNIVSHLSPLLPDGPPRQSMMKELAELRGMLRAPAPGGRAETGGAIARVAEVTLELLGIAPSRATDGARTTVTAPH
jgi:lipid-A-disaccharide synthase